MKNYVPIWYATWRGPHTLVVFLLLPLRFSALQDTDTVYCLTLKHRGSSPNLQNQVNLPYIAQSKNGRLLDDNFLI